MTGDEYLAVLSGDPPTFDASSSSLRERRRPFPAGPPTPGSAWDGLVPAAPPRTGLRQSTRFLSRSVPESSSTIPVSRKPRSPSHPSTDGRVTGQILNHQPGTTYSVQGATPTTNPGTYTTTDGTIVIDDTTGTFTFTPTPPPNSGPVPVVPPPKHSPSSPTTAPAPPHRRLRTHHPNQPRHRRRHKSEHH